MSNTNNATLPSEDRKTFFRLFIPLLSFTNHKYEINGYFDEELRAGHPDIEDLKEVADILWKNPETINEYIEAAEEQFGSFDSEDYHLLESWRHPISGRFILERHLAKGSVFINTESNKVYLVKGLTQSWRDIYWDRSLPILLHTTLIPFKGCIISDGLAITHNIYFGTESRNDFKEFYMNSKQNGKIITTL